MKKMTIDRVAGMNLHYKYYPMETFLRDMKLLDVTAIEIWGAAPHFHLDYHIPADASAYGKRLRAEGFKIVCMTPEQCVYPVNIAAVEKEVRDGSVKFFSDYIDATAAIGAPTMLITSGWGYRDQPIDDAWKYAAESLHILSERAKRNGVKLGLEVLRPDETNLVNDLETMKKMLADVDHDTLGVVVDTNPMSVTNNTLTEYLDAFGEKLYHIHFVDCDPLNHFAWGDGNRDAAAWIAELEQGDYAGYLTLELTHRPYCMEPYGPVKQSINHLKPLMK